LLALAQQKTTFSKTTDYVTSAYKTYSTLIIIEKINIRFDILLASHAVCLPLTQFF